MYVGVMCTDETVTQISVEGQQFDVENGRAVLPAHLAASLISFPHRYKLVPLGEKDLPPGYSPPWARRSVFDTMRDDVRQVGPEGVRGPLPTPEGIDTTKGPVMPGDTPGAALVTNDDPKEVKGGGAGGREKTQDEIKGTDAVPGEKLPESNAVPASSTAKGGPDTVTEAKVGSDTGASNKKK